MPKMNDGLSHWTADEVAECLSITDVLSRRLWEILDSCTNKTPLGGDGTDGTVETPDGRLDPDNDDKAPHWWDKLTEAQQTEINYAYAHDHGENYNADDNIGDWLERYAIELTSKEETLLGAIINRESQDGPAATPEQLPFFKHVFARRCLLKVTPADLTDEGQQVLNDLKGKLIGD